MLRPRIIPCLLVKNGGLVKTVKFGSPKYVGDPINAVRIFNEKQVDELIVADIDATAQGREPDYAMIRNLATECRMPLCYAGGVKTAEQFERIVGLGVEKVAVGSAAVDQPGLIPEAAKRVGSQSIVAVIDVKRSGLLRRDEVFTRNGTRGTGLDAVEFARRAESAGAGEILVNSIDRDGEMKGYDLELARRIRDAVGVPLTVLGGAGSLADMATLIREHGVIGAAAGSLFVFKGRYRAVLINYPDSAEKDALCSIGMQTA
jgi:cyclase